MFSYRHAFHAGNHADVLKHTALVQVLGHLLQKDKPFCMVDTHAGAGLYALNQGYAAQRREHAEGIQRVWQASQHAPALVQAYLEQVRACNAAGALTHYPGSPQIGLQMLRPADKLVLFELHTTEARQLARQYEGQRQVTVHARDGFDGLKAVLPPPSRRGVVLIDPSYEDKRDYRRVVLALREAVTRFATGTFIVWYPQVVRLEARELPSQLTRLAGKDWLHATLSVQAPPKDGVGLYGSGVFIINPPYTLAEGLQQALPWLCDRLAQDDTARYTLDAQSA